LVNSNGKWSSIMQNNGVVLIILTSITFFLSTLCATPDSKKTITFIKNLSQQTGIPTNQPFKIHKITFESDVPFSKEEFFYLTNLTSHRFITLDDIYHAHKQLKQKKRFDVINVSIFTREKQKHLHFKLIAHWTLKKLLISGIWFGKHAYENLYLQHPGEIFDISLHQESLDEMKKLLHQKGYFSCLINDELFYNKKEKSITIKISIQKGLRARIDHSNFIVQIPTDTTQETFLANKLQQKLSSFLHNNHYSKKMLTKVKEQIKTILIKQGFPKHHINLKRYVKNKEKQIDLLFTIRIEQKHLFTFEGNHYFSDKQINEKIINFEKPEWLLDSSIIAQQLLHAYYDHGFWQVKVTRKQITTRPNELAPYHYHFTIEEGKRIRIANVIVKDATTNKEEKNKFFFQPVLNATYYNEKLLNKSINFLKNFYVEHGFWDFTIIDQQYIKENEADTYSIILFVTKGIQRFLDKIYTKNNFDIEKSELVTGLPLNPTKLANQRLSILSHFQKQGFWYVDAQPELVATNTSTNVSVTWNITPGEQVRFGKLYLRGNTRLPFKRIMKEINFMQGDLWDRKKLDYSRKKLKKLDIFKYIEIHPKKISHQQSSKPIILTLVDDNPFELKLRSGYFLTSKNFLLKRESTYKFGGSILIKNPLNLADKLSFNTDVTQFEKDFDFCYQVPHPFNSPIVTQCKAYYHKYVHPLEVGKNDSAYEAIQNGFLLGITKEYREQSYYGISIGNEWIRTSRARGNLKLSKNMINTTIPYFFIEPSLVIDNLDDKINTTKGSLTFCSIKMMVPETTRSITYRIMLEHAMFHHFGNKIVGALRIRWGHMFREKFEEIMPIERFFLGGPSTVRGYSKDTVPPLGKTLKQCLHGKIIEEYTIQGGSSMINGNAELRFPIYKSLGLVLFHDIGVLSQSGFSGFKGKWSPASGWGLRYQTPVGALRFDIGWKWNKSFPQDTRYAWYLTLGQAF